VGSKSVITTVGATSFMGLISSTGTAEILRALGPFMFTEAKNRPALDGSEMPHSGKLKMEIE